MRSYFGKTLAVVLLAATAALIGCEGYRGSEGQAQGFAAVNVTGTWDGSTGHGQGNRVVLVLTQRGGSVSGTATAGTSVSVTGSVTDDQITLSFALAAVTKTLSGTVRGDIMSGTWRGNDGSRGSWSATRR